MDSSIFVSASLVASFIAGMIALFAPCCISFLLPAYFGTLFKEKKRVLFMTLIYSLGIFTVFMPIILGAHLVFNWFMQYHDEVFLAGAVFMIIIGVLTLAGWKLPMPRRLTNWQAQRRATGLGGVSNVYLLGIFSGLTSSCCAPVLLGVMSFSAMSPQVWQAFGIGIFYVLGMVFPLYLASLALEKKQVLGRSFFRRQVWGRVLVSNLISFIIFSGTGATLFVLTVMGKVTMQEWAQTFAQWTAGLTSGIASTMKGTPLLDLLLSTAIICIIVLIIRSAIKKNKQNNF